MRKVAEKKKDGYKVQVLGNKCYRCGHEWRPRSIEKKATVCPGCKSPYWDKPRKISEKGGKNHRTLDNRHDKE